MQRAWTILLVATPFVAACAGNPDRQTLSSLHDVEPDMTEVQVSDGLDQAMVAYRSFLEEAPESSLTPEAMRRLADLKIEKEYGLLGDGGGKPKELPAPKTAQASPGPAATDPAPGPPAKPAEDAESERDFERRATGGDAIASRDAGGDLELPAGENVAWSGPLEAIELYDKILAAYPNYQHNDQVLYQKARAYDELGRNDDAIQVIELLIARYPHSRYIDEVQFRRAEYFFTRRRYLEAEEAYASVVAMGVASQYYELALYKLGWSLYKQELHEEALRQYVALLDHKVSIGYDFDQTADETEERRVADTYRVISLSFSNLGGPEAVEQYFSVHGNRSYEDRIYRHYAEFYLEKLRYNDAAAVYQTFVRLYPLHRSSPHFSMRVVEIYEKGGFPRLVLESKKDFASRYGLTSDYWRHFQVADSPDVLRYLKGNLEDLANHYHAQYQDPERADDKSENFAEALQWYREYLASFPKDPETPAIHYQLADLHLENRDFGEAAREYERTAYDYPGHEKSAAAGYAAIFAHRENQKQGTEYDRERVRREAVASTLRFVETFPAHEHAATVLGKAVDDLYAMKEYERAIATGHELIGDYPEADAAVRRDAWAVVGHASFDVARYVEAEQAYARVLEMTAPDEKTHQAVVDNLAAAIYKQGEQANLAEDYRTAAGHFLRIVQAAPGSEIRPVAEFDAGAALIRLEDWAGAASVLESFRQSHPDHDLHREATKQMAFVYKQQGNPGRAAEEYERVAAEADEPELKREALLVAGELYEEAALTERALAVYQGYVRAFPKPLELAVETRFKVAGIHRTSGDEKAYRAELQRIVDSDRKAGEERSDRVRYLGARSALVLTEDLFQRFEEVQLVQPFEKHLARKQQRMSAALDAFGRLVDYEVGEVTAAATFYVAEIYFGFSKALMESERPADLAGPELLDYELVLEEEAFPFEERSIEVHEKNLELMTTGVYNRWTEKSLEKLAVMMPGRYAKFEASSGWIESIDRYAYRAPDAGRAEPEPGEAPATAPEEPEPAAEPAPEPAAEAALEKPAADAGEAVRHG